MNLVKWFRKNNTKLMAIVVIVLMIGFIGGSSLTYLLRGKGNANKPVAYYGKDIAIKGTDVMAAQKELEILEALQAGTILKALQDPIEQSPNMQSLVLGELLFSGQRPSKEVVAYIQQTIGKYQFRINKKQINDLYKSTEPNFYYWFLLDKEAEKAGFKVQNDASRIMLSQALPQLTGQTYSQLIGNIMNKSGISEDKILSIFGKLLAIIQYSHSICSGQDITLKQLKIISSSQRENIDIQFVRFNSEKFISKNDKPTNQQISEQFEKYKLFLPDEITPENPYGFGYKLPERVQLEYMAFKLDDIKKIVKEPTFDEQSQFYKNNLSNFTTQVKVNPDDPNSGTTTKTKLFSEVADQISAYLLQEKVNQKAESILQEAQSLANDSLEDYNDAELDKLSVEERAKLAGKYADIAEQLSAKYNIKIYNGETGELSAEDIQTDKLLSQLYVQGYVSELSLAQIAFDVEEFNLNLLGSYETIKSKIYLSFSPIKDKSATGKIMAIARVVKAIESSVPENFDLTYSKKPFILDPNQENKKEYTYSTKEKVTKDIKCLNAMATTKTKADEFLALATAQDDQVWENVIDKFNEIYEQEYPKDANEPNLSLAEDSNQPPLKLEEHYSLTKFTKETLLTIAQNQDNPASEELQNLLNKESQFLDQIFSLVPTDSNDSEFKPQIIEFKPDLSYYVIKSISEHHLWKENYEQMKALMSYRKDMSDSQSLAMVHFNPANILKRMDFRLAKDKKESSDEKNIAKDE